MNADEALFAWFYPHPFYPRVEAWHAFPACPKETEYQFPTTHLSVCGKIYLPPDVAFSSYPADGRPICEACRKKTTLAQSDDITPIPMTRPPAIPLPSDHDTDERSPTPPKDSLRLIALKLAVLDEHVKGALSRMEAIEGNLDGVTLRITQKWEASMNEILELSRRHLETSEKQLETTRILSERVIALLEQLSG